MPSWVESGLVTTRDSELIAERQVEKMIWGAPNTGYYAEVDMGQVNCQPRLVLRQEAVKAEQDKFEVNFRLKDKVLKCKTMIIGVPRPDQMAEFSASFAINKVEKAPVQVGFIQNLRSAGTRVAIYGKQGAGYKFWRDGSGIQVPLLDCGTNARPWFGGESAWLLSPTQSQEYGQPSLVQSGDNPRWTVPISYEGLPLASVELKNSFRLFAVAKVNERFIPICRTDWETDITWSPTFGLRAHIRKDPHWVATAPAEILRTDGRTANESLEDRVNKF